MFGLKNILKTGLLVTFYLVVGIVFTYPLINKLTTHIPNNLFVQEKNTFVWGDHLQIVAGYTDHKNYLKNIVEGEPLYQKEFCFDRVKDCELNGFGFLKNVIFSPYWIFSLLNLVFNGPVVNNLVILLSFPLVGIPTYLLSSFLLNKKLKLSSKYNWLVALTASLFITLAPIRLHHLLVGHKNGYLISLLIFAFLFFEYYLHKRKLLFIVIASSLLVYLSFSEQFFTYYGILYFGIRIIFEELPFKLAEWKPKVIEGIKKYWIISIGIVMSVLVNLVSKYQEIEKSDIAKGRPFELIEFFSPPNIGYLWESVILEHEHNVYIGWVSIFLISIGLFILIKSLINKQSTFNFDQRKSYYFFFFCTIFFLLTSLGSLTPIYSLLYSVLPGFSFSRTPVRALFIALPFVGITYTYLVAYFHKYLSKKIEFGVLSFVFILVIYSLRVSPSVSLTTLPNVIGIPENLKVLLVPIAESGHYFNSVYEYEISNSNAVTINGYHPYKLNHVASFEKDLAHNINQSALRGEKIEVEYEYELKELKIDKVIIMQEYLSDSRIEKL